MKKLIKLIFEKKLLRESGIVIFHRNKSSEENLPNYFELIEERIYGLSKITFGKLLY